MTTIKNIKHVIRELKANDNYNRKIMRLALKDVKEYAIDCRSISVEFEDDNTLVRYRDERDDNILELEYRANSKVAYVLAGLGGAY
jgi:hypothetical protein